MTALVPLNNPDALPRLHEAGVGEVYVGFHDDAWESRFGNAELNRMSGFGREANPFDFAEMCSHITRAADLGMRAFVCFNATGYSAEQLEFIAQSYFPQLAESGAHGVILSSLGGIDAARSAGLNVTMSTIAGIYNARLADFYRQCGATRVILPRDMSANEIAGIVQAVPDLEYEVFLMRNGCLFSDSHCLGCHRAGHPSLCTSLRSGEHRIWLTDDPRNQTLDAVSAKPDEFLCRAWENEQLLNDHYHRRTCGLCALWRFDQLGIDAYKVVGRGDDVDDLCYDAALVVRNLAFARTCASEAEYLAGMEPPRDPETLCGMRGLSCYYPELRRTRTLE